jgi:putative FmdB family regulatory protein|tara:strand:+ start:467 stop:706 length:240 start_codon:yes stop_codon:yes gene_type:complete
MPSYVYECSDCKEITEVFHSMSEERTDCDTCGTENTLNRIPEVPIYLKKNTSGNVVKQHIEDAKRQVKEDKQDMRKDHA